MYLGLKCPGLKYAYYPTRGTALCSLQRAKLAILAVYVTSAVVCIPNYMVTSSSLHGVFSLYSRL